MYLPSPLSPHLPHFPMPPTLTQALVNVGSMFAKEVQGRVCTEVDARLANSTDKMVDTVHQLVGLYGEVGVPTDKLIFRLPGVSG